MKNSAEPKDLADLLAALDPAADLAHRHLWLIYLLNWVRGKRDSVPAAVGRVQLFVEAVAARPDIQVRLRAWWATLVDQVDITTLLADFGFAPRTVSAQLANIAKTRPDETGTPVPCETWDNALLMCEAQNAAGDAFPMQLEMKRMAPGCTNTVEYEIYGLNMSAKFTTDDPNAIHYTQAVGREQAWARLVIGQKTLYPVITGSIFEFGFSDSLLQMFAAFVSELRGLPCTFGCFTPAEAHQSHRVLTAALEAYTQNRVVTLE